MGEGRKGGGRGRGCRRTEDGREERGKKEEGEGEEVKVGGAAHCKVHQMELSHAYVLLLVRANVTALHSDGEDDMGTRRVIIHVSRCKLP